ncbi:MAG: hypothetical protein K6T92_02860, partial [Candidatus Rokubacteria bacterium]|nr:hypothetical protein [Candidatus Rokubacteria bacterium]
MTTADLTGAAVSTAPAWRGWRRWLSFLGDEARGTGPALADLHAREAARALALRELAGRLAAVPSLSERLRGLAERAQAAARRLGEVGAPEAPAALEPAATLSEG